MENIQKSSMSLVLSTDAKPRLKWTSELHLRFVEAVNQLEATPKSLMRVMGVPGLTLYHLKSHLQKYRLGKSQQGGSFIDDKHEVFSVAENQEVQSNNDHENLQGDVFKQNRDQINGSLQITQALQMQMEVQKKLHEQIEVQRHLQVRIEAQGKYLQSVLKKAQETLARYTSSSLGVEFARAELSRLVSMVNKHCPSSSFSELTQAEEEEEENDVEEERGCLGYKKPENMGITTPICSMESSLTSSESSGREEDHKKLENENNMRRWMELPLMEINPQVLMNAKKRSSEDPICVEQPMGKRMLGVHEGEHLRLDLNSQYNYKKGIETCPNVGLDLN